MTSADGFLVLDKPGGMTSHDVVAAVRRVLRERRVGHAGTLDPDATGVLVLGVGRATRLLRYVGELEKTYVGEIVLGIATSTLDAAGEVVATFDMSAVTLPEVEAAAAALTGPILQVPPMVSAVKVGGRRLHELARAGIEVERAPRPVTVHEFTVETTADPAVYRATVRCSSGTYVRVLAADLGAALGGGAHLRNLRRSAIGPFRVEEACALDALTPAAILPPAGLVAHLESVIAADGLAGQIAHGAVLSGAALGAGGDGPIGVLSSAGDLLAVYARAGRDRWKPEVVLAEAALTSARAPAPASGERGPVVTVGNFDGVHRGHLLLLGRAHALAERDGRRLVVVTFDRHPAATIRPGAVPPLLTDAARKRELLLKAGADDVVMLPFDGARAAQTPEEFVREVLIGQLHAHAVVVGTNFRFGHGAAGDLALLTRLGAAEGIDVVGVDLAASEGAPVSSTRIRRLIADGRLGEAAVLLGRPHAVAAVARGADELVVGAGLLLPPLGSYSVELFFGDGSPQALSAEVCDAGRLHVPGAGLSAGAACTVAFPGAEPPEQVPPPSDLAASR